MFSFNSYGEWVYIDKENNSDTEVYVLTDSIEIEDGYVYWTYLNNYSEPRSEYNIMGVAIFRGAECENNRYINIESQMFQGSMGTKSFGERLKPEQEWTTPSSGQIDEKIFNYVCDYAGLGKTKVTKNSSIDTDGESSKALIEKAVSDAYQNGDYELAIKLILPLAQEGDAYSQYAVGYYYLISSPVYSVEESFKWSKKAAEQNYIPAYSQAGQNYLYGSGVLKDFKKAFYWFKKGAEAGDSNSQHYLAEMYVRGEGALKNYKKAYLWHSKAAEQNNIQSLIYAGEMACKGIGTQKNLVKSKYWMSKAYDEATKFQLSTQKEIIKDFWEECDLANYESLSNQLLLFI